MAPGAELAAVLAIQLRLDQPVRTRDASLKMPELAEMRRDFRSRVAGRTPRTQIVKS